METPTRERPAVQIAGLPIRIVRGYECVPTLGGDPKFIGAHDGPLLEIKGPTSTMVFRVEHIAALREALSAVASVEAGDLEAHKIELASLGYKPIGV